jgi:hypothetical protein
MPFNFYKPRGRPNVCIRIQVDYPHSESRQVIIISASVSTRLHTPDLNIKSQGPSSKETPNLKD